MATMPALRPLDLGEILDAAFRVFGRRWRTLVVAALAIGVPLSLASTGLVLGVAPEQFDLEATENPLTRLTEPGQSSALAAVTAARLIDLVASALAFAACLRVAAADYAGRDPGPGAALSFGLRHLPGTVGVLLVVGIGVGIGIVLLIVPGIWLATIWALALPALVLERTGVFGALARSRALVRGRFWAVLGLLLLAFVITLVCAGIVGAVAGGFATAGGAGDEAAGAVASFVSSVASIAVAVPVAAAMLFVMYVDQRVRGEGLTRDGLARELDDGGDGTGLGAPADGYSAPGWSSSPQDAGTAPPQPWSAPQEPRPAPPDLPGPELPGGWQPPRPGP